MDATNPRNSRRRTPPSGNSKSGRTRPSRRFDLVLSEQWLRQVPGIALAALGLFGFFGILAYFFTWQGDYAQVSGGSRWMYLVEGPTADHWLGRSGALVSHLLVNRGFGPAALFIPWIMLLVGIRLMFIDSTLQLGRRIYSSLVLMLSLSCTLSYLGNDLAQDGFAWGGWAGNAMSSWLIGFGGTLGTAFILGLFWFVYFSILMGWVFSVAALQSRLPWLFSRPLNTSALDDGMDDGLDSGASAEDGAWRGGVQVEGGGRTKARNESGADAEAGRMNAGGSIPR